MTERESVAILFTAKEILDQIQRELVAAQADLNTFSADHWKQYILARTIEDVLLIDLSPSINPSMDRITMIVQSNYRRLHGEDLITLHQDVGTYKLFNYISSLDLPFESQLELHGNCITIGMRSTA